MKIIITLFFVLATFSAPVYAMEQGPEWDSFIFVPSAWTTIPFDEIQRQNEEGKQEFIQVYRNRFNRITGSDMGFLQLTAQQVVRLGCEMRLRRNAASAIKG